MSRKRQPSKIHEIRVYHGMIGNNHDEGLLTTMSRKRQPSKIHEIRVYHGMIGNNHDN